MTEFERLCEWVRLDACRVRNNPGCIEQHRHSLRALGETEKRLSELDHWRESHAFTEWEKAALSLCETISLHEPEEASALILQTARRHFSPDEIVRLTLTIMAVNDWVDVHEKFPIRFLVVEDDPRDQELLLHQLRETQMAGKVLFVPDALQALDFIEKSRSSSESGLIAIFLDLHLPGMSGVELLQRLRAMPGMEDFPVIVMTSSNNPRDMEECGRLKVLSYVQKPVTLASFSKSVAVANLFHQMKDLKAWVAKPALRQTGVEMQKRKILVVDDEVTFTNIVKLTLEMKNHCEVCVENDPRMALATARKFSPDIVLLDVVMPELNGAEVHRQFMADPGLRHIPIIFLTAIVRQKEVDEHKGMIGGSFFIAKPVSADGLINAIEEHIRS
jgi:CheY-like chemotaxis protein